MTVPPLRMSSDEMRKPEPRSYIIPGNTEPGTQMVHAADQLFLLFHCGFSLVVTFARKLLILFIFLINYHFDTTLWKPLVFSCEDPTTCCCGTIWEVLVRAHPRACTNRWRSPMEEQLAQHSYLGECLPTVTRFLPTTPAGVTSGEWGPSGGSTEVTCYMQ